MATEHIVRKHRPAAGHTHTVAVAAPLLVIQALMVAFSRSPVALAADSSPELVELTFLAGARGKGAVCLDGSSPAYQLQRGFGSGSRSWLLYLQGGAWCSTTEECSGRATTDLGSSNHMNADAVEFVGILSNKHPQNPDFYNWNKVFIRYCDGASFSGDAEGEDQDGNKLFFRGLRIWEAVVDELMRKGMDNAEQALLAGCSAGGLATLLHCDNFRARFPKEVSVKCLPDAGFFLDIKDLSGERFMRSIFNGTVHLQNVSKVLPKDCLAKKDPTECFFPAVLIKSIKTPTFILNSEYDSWQIGNALAPDGSYLGGSWSSCKSNIGNCNSRQIDVLHGLPSSLVSFSFQPVVTSWILSMTRTVFFLGRVAGFRKKFISELKDAEGKRDWGLFIDSCFVHCQTQSSDSWHSPISPRLGNKTIAEAVGDWYFGRRKGVKLKQIDCKYPCNPTCGS